MWFHKKNLITFFSSTQALCQQTHWGLIKKRHCSKPWKVLVFELTKVKVKKNYMNFFLELLHDEYIPVPQTRGGYNFYGNGGPRVSRSLYSRPRRYGSSVRCKFFGANYLSQSFFLLLTFFFFSVTRWSME